MSNHIGTLSEKSLHAQIKAYLTQPGDLLEQPVDGFVIDLVRDGLLMEVQTRNFSAMKRKLAKLLPHYPILLFHPIPQTKWIVRQTAVSERISRRKSPKTGNVYDLFRELIRIPHLLTHPNLSICVLLTEQEEVLRDDGQGSWRRKHWSKADMRLVTVVESHQFDRGRDYLQLLPADLPAQFTNQDLAKRAKLRANLAQRMTYTLKHAGLLNEVGKQGRWTLFEVANP